MIPYCNQYHLIDQEGQKFKKGAKTGRVYVPLASTLRIASAASVIGRV